MATLTAPGAVAMDSRKLKQVKQLFQEQIDEGLHPGAGLSVYRYGNLVLDIHGGIANTEPVTANTMFVLMSSTKPLTASCLYILKERGGSHGTTWCPSTGPSSPRTAKRP